MTAAGIKVAFSPYDIDREYTLDVSSADPEPLEGEGEAGKDYQIKMFDVTLNGKSDFDDAIKIIIPYDDTFIDNDSVESDSVAGMYFNQETNKYESEVYTVDTDKNEITIYTNHLSQHGGVVYKSSYAHGPFTVDKEREYTRFARITDVNSFSKFVNSETAQNVVQGLLENDFTTSDGQAFQAGFNEANTWLGLTATGNTITGSAFSSAFLTNLTNSFNLLGVGASLVQVGIDFQNGDDQALYTNLLKNSVYNTVNYVGWGSLQLAFAGVFIIDYSLNTFATKAFEGNTKKWKEAYDCCYNQTRLKSKKVPDLMYKKDHKGWYRYIRDEILPDIKNPERLLNVVETEIYNDALDVWTDKGLLDCVLEVTDGGGYAALGGEEAAPKTLIAMEKKAEVLNSLQPVFFEIGKDMNDANREKYKETLSTIQNMLNQKVDFTITGASKYKGYSVRFVDLNEKAKAASWKGAISSGTIHTTFTYLGYMESGSPKRVEIFDPVNDRVFKTITIGKISPVMSFEINDTISKPVASPPSGTEFSDSLDVTLSSPDNVDIVYWIDDGDATLYSGPVTLTGSATIFARADKDPYDENAPTSEVATFEYTKTESGAIRKPVASPPSGTEFSDSIDVALSSPDNVDIVYMIDDGDATLYSGPITLTDSATVYAYADKDPYDVNAPTSGVVAFEYTKTDASTGGKWVLYYKEKIDGCSFYESDCYPLESCSGGEGSYQVSIGYSTCGCDTCGGDSGSGTYTVPPASLTPGATIPFAVTATGDGYTSVGVCFYTANSGITSDQVIIGNDGTNQGISPASCSTIVKNSSPKADWTVPDWGHNGVIKIEGGGSIGSFETSMSYYFLYKWQE